MSTNIDEDLQRLERLLSIKDWPRFEKRYLHIITFYLIHEKGKIFYRDSDEPIRLLRCSRFQKDLAALKLMDFFRLVIKQKEDTSNKEKVWKTKHKTSNKKDF